MGMKLYEINAELEKAIDELDFDFETGEMGENYDDALFQKVQELSIERTELLQYLAKVALNTKAEAEAVKYEMDRLAKRKKTLDNRYASLVNILDRECAGEKTDLGVATVSYRSTAKVEIADEIACLAWLKDNNHKEAFKVEEKINKTELKAIIKKEGDVPGAEIVSSKSCSLR